MAKLVMATEGDTLCTLAIAHGFIDCTQLRKEPNNQMYLNRPLRSGDWVTIPELKPTTFQKAADALHKLIKKSAPPVAIRFVRGTADEKHYMHDPVLTALHVSNYVTNKAGANGRAAFPSGFGFNADADADPDTFKVEVTDPGASGSVTVKLEALRPERDKKTGNTIYKPFEGVSDANKRKIDAVTCKALSDAPKAFRSAYLRLVTDKEDHGAAAAQALLVSDCVDDNDEGLEILDQKVRATYVITRCPGNPKCAVRTELPVGSDRWRVKVAIHIIKDPNTGAAVAATDATRKRVLQSVRRRFAQADMSVSILSIDEVPAPSNMFAIAEPAGKLAIGAGAIKVKVKIGAVEKQVAITTVKDDKPGDTAMKLADAINQCFAANKPPVAANARVSDNPPRLSGTIASADVLVGDPRKDTIVLSIEENGDINHPVEVGRMTSADLDMTDDDNVHIGTPMHRVLVKNYDTGVDRVDMFFVGDMTDAYGLGVPPLASFPAKEQTNDQYRNTALLVKTTVTTNNLPVTIPHELGHILMDAFHADVTTELMYEGGHANAHSLGMDGRKRISEPIPPAEIDMGCKKGNAVRMLRSENSGPIEKSW